MLREVTSSARTGFRPPVAAFAAVCGVATALGGLVTWISARGPRPRLGMTNTSLRRMLVYEFVSGVPFWESVGFVMLILGILMAIGALIGIRTITVLAAVLALGDGGMWIGLVVHHFNTPNLPNSHYANPISFPWSDLRVGAWLTIVGAVLGLVSVLFVRRRVPAAAR